MIKMRFVYMVRCSDDSLYTGITNDLNKRMFDHNNSKIWAKYTKSRRPVSLVWRIKVIDRNAASKLELKIKWLMRAQKEVLIK